MRPPAVPVAVRGIVASATRLLPEGRPLPTEEWARRHRWMVGVLLVHAVVLLGFALLLEAGWSRSAAVIVPLLLAAAAGAAADVPRRVRTAVTSLALLGCSAVVVHLTDGATESHLHVFVMLALIALYREWLPLLLGVGSVLAHHLGVLLVTGAPLVEHRTDPQQWAAVHALYVAAAGGAALLAWRLEERERNRSQRVLDATAEGIYGTDADGVITFANASLGQVLGCDAEELVGRHAHAASGHGDAAGTPLDADTCPVCKALDLADGMAFGDVTFRDRHGRPVPVELTATPARERGLRTGTVVSVRDRTEHVELTDRALRDALTGLPNRSLFMDRLGKALARIDRSGAMIALLFIDLDRFKVVNDSLGHAAGDALLLAAAERLRTSVRGHDTVARFGGDEFVVLCEGLDAEQDVFIVAERIITAFSRPFSLDGAEVSASASVGITVTRDPHAEADSLLRDADAAMYRAKDGGRGRFELFDRGMRSRALRRLQTESDLWRAIARDELVVHYQPVVDLGDGRIVGVEALLRWEHPQRGLVPPGEFLPVAEETGLIAPIGAWVLEEACGQVQRWREEVPGADRLQLAVNLSGQQLSSTTLADLVAEVLDRTGLPASLLCLEITESTLMADVEASAAIMGDLKALGVALAVDDFGTGYSSLAYLSRFPVDILKIDRAFVGELHDGTGAWPIISAIAGLAAALGLEAIAEGVEDDAQLTALRSLGCRLAQGYLFARPAAPGVIAGLLADGSVALSATTSGAGREPAAAVEAAAQPATGQPAGVEAPADRAARVTAG
jgi:diguanylate cyclase (GGDEF)-like protein/PAS domain S-box-containing protein